MNSWQAVLHQVVYADQLVEPKRVALRLHRHPDYLSDICRRDRVDAVAVINAVLQEATQHRLTDPQRMLAIIDACFKPLLVGTPLYVGCAYAVCTDQQLGDLRHKIGELLRDLGGAIDALCDVERDGRVTREDDPSIAEFDDKSNRLCALLGAMQNAIHARRGAEVTP